MKFNKFFMIIMSNVIISNYVCAMQYNNDGETFQKNNIFSNENIDISKDYKENMNNNNFDIDENSEEHKMKVNIFSKDYKEDRDNNIFSTNTNGIDEINNGINKKNNDIKSKQENINNQNYQLDVPNYSEDNLINLNYLKQETDLKYTENEQYLNSNDNISDNSQNNFMNIFFPVEIDNNNSSNGINDSKIYNNINQNKTNLSNFEIHNSIIYDKNHNRISSDSILMQAQNNSNDNVIQQLFSHINTLDKRVENLEEELKQTKDELKQCKEKLEKNNERFREIELRRMIYRINTRRFSCLIKNLYNKYYQQQEMINQFVLNNGNYINDNINEQNTNYQLHNEYNYYNDNYINNNVNEQNTNYQLHNKYNHYV